MRGRPLEQVEPLREEGALLGEGDLVAREVEDDLVGLHLAEVRVDGPVEGQPAPQRGAQVDPQVDGRVEQAGLVADPVVVLGAQREPPGRVRGQGELLHRPEAVQAGQVGEAGDQVPIAALEGDAHQLLVGAGQQPLHREAPDLLGGRREAQDGERDAQLGRPAVGGGRGGPVPHGVPVTVLLVVAVHDLVALHAGGVEEEAVGGAAVVHRVDEDVDLVGVRGVVAPPQGAVDLPGLAVVAGDADVEVPVVVEDPHLGPLRRSLALVGEDLHEAVEGRRGVPGQLLEAAIQDQLPLSRAARTGSPGAAAGTRTGKNRRTRARRRLGMGRGGLGGIRTGGT